MPFAVFQALGDVLVTSGYDDAQLESLFLRIQIDQIVVEPRFSRRLVDRVSARPAKGLNDQFIRFFAVWQRYFAAGSNKNDNKKDDEAHVLVDSC